MYVVCCMLCVDCCLLLFLFLAVFVLCVLLDYWLRYVGCFMMFAFRCMMVCCMMLVIVVFVC